YEDRSRLAQIRDLTNGMEASLELEVKLAGGYQVKNRRTFGSTRLFIFEVVAFDPGRTGREVMVWWFVSGRKAFEIIKYYTKKLERGVRFITFGRWEWDTRRGTYSLHLHKPADELELLTPLSRPGKEDATDSEEQESDPSLAAIHVGRRVPI